MRLTVLLLVLWITGVCGAATAPATQPSLSVSLSSTQTCENLGACQGATQHDGFVYLYGDANPGVIRQYRVQQSTSDSSSTLTSPATARSSTSPSIPSRLDYTGLEIRLTRNGENIINHPTGLTFNPQFGTYLGNTITRTKKGTIFHLDWPRMLIDKNLDHAVLNTIDDDLAIQGCRPEFVRKGDRWLLATADYGNVENAIRIYDPIRLASAKKTSEPGVLVERHPCGGFVQQLHWIDSRQILLLIENQISGRRWRLVEADLWNTPDLRTIKPYDELSGLDELEGFSLIDPDHCVLVTSSKTNNCTFARIKW